MVEQLGFPTAIEVSNSISSSEIFNISSRETSAGELNGFLYGPPSNSEKICTDSVATYKSSSYCGTKTAIEIAEALHCRRLPSLPEKAGTDKYSLHAPLWLNAPKYHWYLNETEARYWSKDRKIVQSFLWNMSARIAQRACVDSEENLTAKLLKKLQSKMISDCFNINYFACKYSKTEFKPRSRNSTNVLMDKMFSKLVTMKGKLRSDEQEFFKIIEDHGTSFNSLRRRSNSKSERLDAQHMLLVSEKTLAKHIFNTAKLLLELDSSICKMQLEIFNKLA